MQVGTKVVGIKQQTTNVTALSTGQVYEVNVTAESGIVDPTSVINFVMGKWNEQFPELRITWMNVNPVNQTIDIQFTPVAAQSLGLQPQPQRLWVVSVITWLPAILTLIGIAGIAIALYLLVASIPWYLWVALIGGALLVVGAPVISNLFKTRVPKRKK